MLDKFRHLAWGAGVFALAMTACSAEPQQDASSQSEFSPLVETGRDIAARNCAQCHSIERTGGSPLAEALPLRLALADFDIEALATDFREHVQIGTDVMPEFDFTPLQTDALMAYLLTIETVQNEN